jgi:actin-like protein 6A
MHPTGENSGTAMDVDDKHTFSPTKYKENLEILSPIADGIVVDWDLLEKLWNYSLGNYLKYDNLKGLPVLVTEKPYNPPVLRQKYTEMMFESFNVSAFFLAKDSVLSCYALGKTSGLVVDCSGSGTTISPVSDGWNEYKGMSRSSVGGRVMDGYLMSLLTKKLKTLPKPLYRLQKTVLTERNNEINVLDNINALTGLSSFSFVLLLLCCCW